MKKYIITLLLGTSIGLAAQVPKKVIVEHFTNTLCSVCANRNPGFRNNLNAQDSNVLYISYHPSSPYVNCMMNKHNVRENDGRTRFYGVYGSTPRLVIQGNVIPANANYNAQSMFDPYLNQTSPVSMMIRQYKTSDDKLVSKLVIRTVASHSLYHARLFFAIAEDTIDYNAPNSEKKHYHVFRKALTDSNGMLIRVPKNIDDSFVYVVTTPFHNDWNKDKIMQVAILHDSLGKNAIQAASALASQSDPELGVKTALKNRNLNVYPNPAIDVLYFDFPIREENSRIEISDMTGRILLEKQAETGTIDVTDFKDGLYLVRVYSSKSASASLFRKESD